MIALVNMAQALFLMGASAAVASVCCSGGDDDQPTPTEQGAEGDIDRLEEPSSPEDPGSAATASSSSEGAMTLSDKELTADNPDLMFVLRFDGDVSEEYLNHLKSFATVASQYAWSSNKRMTANEAAWKDLAKRISTLQTEGFDVKPGSDAAKERRRLVASQKNQKPRLLDQFEVKKKKKKKKSKSSSKEK